MHEGLSNRAHLQTYFLAARDLTLELCQPLVYDDYLVQSAPFVSPPKWHLGHTTWFFETFALQPYCAGYEPLHPKYRELFNSYYHSVERPMSQAQRSLLTRPSLQEVLLYRDYVEDALVEFLSHTVSAEALQWIELGIEHEEQHQELLLMDIKHIFHSCPLQPLYAHNLVPISSAPSPKLEFVDFAGGRQKIGYDGELFSFDNERPAHLVDLRPFALANRLATNRDFLEFIDDGGYDDPDLWLSDGWEIKTRENWNAPLYWEAGTEGPITFTLRGQRRLVYDEPVCHVSYYEADAFARWAGARLPTESEWETASAMVVMDGSFLEAGHFHPSVPNDRIVSGVVSLSQMFGEVWQWTQSPYLPYPGYRRSAGALGEYNAKFMCNQFVLRGGSFGTPTTHIRPTYRNFYAPQARWQFAGLRLAKDVG
jgi:ergothioneine biosynthesis protein EgtB